MDIDIAVPAGLQLLRIHKKLLVEGLVQLIKDQAPLGGHQRAVGIAVLFIADVHNGLTFFVHLVQHPDKILFVIPVIPIAFRHHGTDLVESPLHNIVHLGDGDLSKPPLLHLFLHKTADIVQLLLTEGIEHPVSGLVYRHHNFLHVKLFSGIIFFDDTDLFKIHLSPPKPVHWQRYVSGPGRIHSRPSFLISGSFLYIVCISFKTTISCALS